MRCAGVIDFGKLTNPRHEEAPAILGCGLHHRRAALAFWPRRSSKAHTEFRNAGVDRKTCRTEGAAASLNTLHAPLQIATLNICLGEAESENRGELLGRNPITQEIAELILVVH